MSEGFRLGGLGQLRDRPKPEDRLNDLIGHLNAIIWEADCDTLESVFVSQGAEKILGYPVERWYTEPDFLDIRIHPADRDRIVRERRSAIAAGRDYGADFRMLAADGRVVWLRADFSVGRYRSDGRRYVRAVMLDVTEGKRAEEYPQEAPESLHDLGDYSSDIIFRTDAAGNFTLFTVPASAVIKYRREELVGRHFLELIRPDYREAVRRFYLRQARSRTLTSYCEVPLVSRDGAEVWLGQNVQLLLDGGHVTGYHAIARDITDRKKTEEALRDSEQRYRIVAETATDAIVTVDQERLILYVNQAAEKIFGYAVSEMLGQDLSMLIPDSLRSAHNPSLARYLKTGEKQTNWNSVEFQGLHRDRHEIPLEISFGQFTHGTRHCFTAIIRDITERKRAREALRHNEERFQSMIENSTDVIVVVDRNGKVIYESPSVERLLGYRPEERVGQSCFENTHPDDKHWIRESFARRLQSADPPHQGPTEVRVRHKDGSWRTIEVVSRNLLDNPSVSGIVVNMHDVTERKRTEEELRKANDTLRALIQASPLAIVSMDYAGRVSQWNPAAEKMFGWNEAEAMGRPLPYVPADKLDDNRELRDMLRRGSSVNVERTRCRKDGSLIDISVSAAPLIGPDGAVSGAVAVITEITERKRMEDHLRQSQKMEAVGKLAGGVAHDFNNLLTVITGYNQLILTLLSPGDRARGYAEQILKAAGRASALTTQLLAFSRRQVVQPRVLDINTLVANMGGMLRRLIGEDIELVTLLKAHLRRVKADAGQIEQVIMNLAVNARDAMPSGGRLTIETADVDLNEDYSRTHAMVAPGHYVLVAVTDTGHGIDERTKERIFEPFFTTKEVGKGTGLGLSTVYGIVRQSDGHVWVYSEPGKGSTFKVYLPAVEELPELAEPDRGEVSVRGSETILVVEDESSLRRLVRELLEPLGYKVLAARDPREAIEVCHLFQGTIHLLLTDVVMPRSSGRELAEQLRPARPDMRVLYMSGYPDETIVSHGILESGLAFLQKPFTQDALEKRVRSVLDGPHTIHP